MRYAKVITVVARTNVFASTASLAAQMIANTISTANHNAHSAFPGIGRRATFVGRFGRFGVSMTLLSGRLLRDVDDLQLEAVRVVEEHRVVAEHVPVLLRLALDLRVGVAQPRGTFVDGGARARLDGEMVQPDRVAV